MLIGLALALPWQSGNATPQWIVDLITQTGVQADYYVDPSHPSASDSNAGTSPNSPWSTLTKVKSTFEALASSASAVVFCRAATYTDQTLSISIAANTGITMTVAFEPGAIMSWTLGTAPSNGIGLGNVSGNTIRVYGNGLQINNYNPTSGNGVGSNSGTVYVYDVIVDNAADGASTHGTDGAMYVYDSIFRNCTTGAFNNTGTNIFQAYRCTFEGRSGATAGIGSNEANVTPLFEDCTFTPATAGQSMIPRAATFTRCVVGSTTVRVNIDTYTGVNFTDCYLNLSADLRFPATFTRCYGKTSFRVRGATATGTATFRNCVFVGNSNGITSGHLYANFDPNDGTWDGLVYDYRDCILTGYVTAVGAGFSANQFAKFNTNSKLDNISTFGNTTGIHASITIETNELTTDPDIGVANTTVKSDYGYAPGSPAIGAGFGGGNIGFAA